MVEIELNPFTESQTDRLILRQLKENDAPEILFHRTNDAMMQYIDREKISTLEEARNMIEEYDRELKTNERIMWGICLKGEEKIIGTIGLWYFIKAHHRAEIGYLLHPGFWQKGIMGEAMEAVLNYAFKTLKLHTIEANINPANLASRKLLEKHGFIQEAYFKENYYFRGKFLDTVILSLIDPASSRNADAAN